MIIIITNALEQGTLQVNGAVGRWQSIGDSLSDVRPRGLCEDEVLSPLKLRGFIRKLILVPAQSMKKKNHLVALRGRFNPIENEKISKSPNTTLTQWAWAIRSVQALTSENLAHFAQANCSICARGAQCKEKLCRFFSEFGAIVWCNSCEKFINSYCVLRGKSPTRIEAQIALKCSRIEFFQHKKNWGRKPLQKNIFWSGNSRNFFHKVLKHFRCCCKGGHLKSFLLV